MVPVARELFSRTEAMAVNNTALNSRQLGAEQTRHKLLQVCLKLFSTTPYELVKIAAVAELAGVAHGLVFHHFGSKRGCYLEAMREAVRMLDEASPLIDRGSFRRSFHPAMVKHLEFMARHESLALQLILPVGGDPDIVAIFEGARSTRVTWIASQLALDVGKNAVAQALNSWVGTVDRGTMHWLRAGRVTTVNDLARFFFELLVASVESIAMLDRRLDLHFARERIGVR